MTTLSKLSRQAAIGRWALGIFLALYVLFSALLNYYQDEHWLKIFTLVSLLLTALFLWVNNRKHLLELTDEDLQIPVAPDTDYSNRWNWRQLLLILLLILYGYAGLFFTMFVKDFVQGGLPQFWSHMAKILALMPVSWWLLIGIAVVLPVMALVVPAANTYKMEGDTLIINERNLFRREEEMRIPVSSIDKVYLKAPWAITPGVYIEVEGIKRQLRANTHALELAVDILRRKRLINAQ